MLPTIYQDRLDVSLYDAQYHESKRIPIPEGVITQILSALQEFEGTCAEFRVPASQALLVATEATRTALNGEDFVERIKKGHKDWIIKLLTQEEEAFYGAMGVASSFGHPTTGLFMDMGGGSVQLSWVDKAGDGRITSKLSRSFPFGAAKLTAGLTAIHCQDDEVRLLDSITTELTAFLEDIRAIKTISDPLNSGIKLFLSGGGFRRWGFLMMTLDHVQPYPIPIINGFTVSETKFLSAVGAQDSGHQVEESHRISKRGASQIPAVRLFLRAFLETLNAKLSSITFCQGAVREGILFSHLPADIRAMNPLEAATALDGPASAATLANLLTSAIPDQGAHKSLTPSISNSLFIHSTYSKDNRASAALRCTTTGCLGNASGLSHSDRAALALILCERWGGEDDLPPVDKPFYLALQKLQGSRAAWWARYVGCVAKGLADIYPAGRVRDSPVFEIKAEVKADSDSDSDSDSQEGFRGRLRVEIRVLEERHLGSVERWAKKLKQVGKKGSWVTDGTEGLGWGMKVHVDVLEGSS